MPRPNPKKSGIGKTTSADMKRAVYDIVEGGLSTKASSLRHNIPRTTLRRYLAKCERNRDSIDWNSEVLLGAPRMTPNYSVNAIFTREEEAHFGNYLQTMTKLHHGLNPKSARKLAFDLADANNKKIPVSWRQNKMAGKFWFTGFMKRNVDLSLRLAEATSLSRATGFNRPVVSRFFSKLNDVIRRYEFTPDRIYNVDETGLTTVQETGKVIAKKGQRQVGQIVSQERGTLVTMCGAINAIGNSIPPFLVFPRKFFKDYMIKNAPPGTQGVGSISGWMTADLFVQWIQHFIKHVKPTKDLPVLLLMDNHESHVSFDTIKLAKNNNLILLTIPPHTSHRLQPLDRGVYGPLKKYYNQECQKWLLRNPGKRITIYEIAEILGEAYPLAFCPRNIISAFKSTGIYPCNENIFSDDDFLAASVTDVPENIEDFEVNRSEAETHQRADVSQDVLPSTSFRRCNTPDAISSTSVIYIRGEKTPEKRFISPEQLNPFPKVSSAPSKRRRNKKTAEILTDTPIYLRIEEEATLKKSRKYSIGKQKCVKRNLSVLSSETKKPTLRKKEEDSEDSDSDIDISEVSNSDDVEDYSELENALDTDDDFTKIDVNTFVLVKFNTKKTSKFYVGKIMEILTGDDEYYVSFLRRHGRNFSYPNIPDCATILKDDIVLKLPQPKNGGGTDRTANLLYFSLDLTSYNVC